LFEAMLYLHRSRESSTWPAKRKRLTVTRAHHVEVAALRPASGMERL